MSRRWLTVPALALLLAVGLAALVRGDSHPAPTNVSVTPAPPGAGNTVTWTASTGADGYRIQWKSGAQDWDPINRQASVTGGSTTTGYIAGLEAGTVYTVRVGATKGTEEPSWSDTVTGIPTFGCASSAHIHSDLTNDCEMLLAIAKTLDPNGLLKQSTDSSRWATNNSMSSWRGVTVHRLSAQDPWYVSEVNLNNGVNGTKLKGSISPLIGKLPKLYQIDLSYNDLTGTLPSEMQSLTKLYRLRLGTNLLSGPLPTWLNELTNVSVIGLNQNSFTGTIPTTWDKLTKLRVLRLDGNELSGGIPAELGVLSNLEELWLDDAGLDGAIPAGTDAQNNPTGLAKLTKLTRLDLGNNELTGGIPAALGGLTKLESLWLRNNSLTGGIPAALGSLTKLRQLYLNGNELTGGIPAALGNLTELTTLQLNGNNLTGGIPAGTDSQDNPTGLAKLTKLRYLQLQGNELSGEIPPALGNLAALRWLLVHYNQLSGEIPAELGNLSNMQYLFLHANRLTGSIPAGTDSNNNATGLAKLSTVYWIYLNCNDLTGTVPDALGSITTLQRLGINGNPNLDPTLPASLSQVETPTVTCPPLPSAVTAPASTPTPTPAPARAPAPQPKLAASLSAAPDPVTVGQTITYTLTVTNTGQVPLTGVFWRSPDLGVGRSDIGDGRLAVGAAVAATFDFGPVTAERLPGPIVVNVFADSDQTDDVRAALGVTVRAAPASAATPTPAPGPRPAVSALDLTIARAGYSSPDPPEPHLGHNILDLSLTLADDTPVACDFLTYYEATGGMTRWGYAISEIVEERLGALTQYYQRGAVDCHFRAGRWRVERRLTWDFLGGGEWGAPDLGVEPHLLSDQPGELLGPWGHRVSNQAVDGTVIGFLDFFEALGGVRAFGYPKTEARRDDHPAAVLRLPGATPGFIRQYFQAAVFEYHPDDPAAPVKFGLAGELMRDLIYPGGAYLPFRSFRPVPPLEPGQPYQAERVIWGPAP